MKASPPPLPNQTPAKIERYSLPSVPSRSSQSAASSKPSGIKFILTFLFHLVAWVAPGTILFGVAVISLISLFAENPAKVLAVFILVYLALPLPFKLFYRLLGGNHLRYYLIQLAMMPVVAIIVYAIFVTLKS